MAAQSSLDGLHRKVYPFEELLIGESVEITGIEGNIRSSASMWGRRYGVWLQVTKIDDGIMKVTRLEAPINPNRKMSFSRASRLEEKVDALSTLVIKMYKLLEERLP